MHVTLIMPSYQSFFVIRPATYAEYHFRLLEVTHIPLTMQKPGNCSLSFLRWKPLLERFSSVAEACLQHPDIFARLLDCCFQPWEAGRSWEIWAGDPKWASALALATGMVCPDSCLPPALVHRAANLMQHKLPTVTKVSSTLAIHRRICRS